MNINELRLRNLQVGTNYNTKVNTTSTQKVSDPKQSPFAKQLQEVQQQKNGVQFSKHAIERINSREIDVFEENKLERLNKGIEIAQQKGASETLVIVDSTAFVVNVKNNKVITTMAKEDMMGNIFTNIDSTVIM